MTGRAGVSRDPAGEDETVLPARIGPSVNQEDDDAATIIGYKYDNATPIARRGVADDADETELAPRHPSRLDPDDADQTMLAQGHADDLDRTLLARGLPDDSTEAANWVQRGSVSGSRPVTPTPRGRVAYVPGVEAIAEQTYVVRGEPELPAVVRQPPRPGAPAIFAQTTTAAVSRQRKLRARVLLVLLLGLAVIGGAVAGIVILISWGR